jgi:hypothetical protein
MSGQSKFKPQIQKAEDLPKILSAQPRWNSIRECERSIFRSLDLSLVLDSKITLLDAMDFEVKNIISDALKKGILERKQDGSVVIKVA